jgi:hypothetical protein
MAFKRTDEVKAVTLSRTAGRIYSIHTAELCELAGNTHTHNLFTPGGRTERAANASLTLHFLCYVSASSAHISSLARFFV